MTFVFQVLWRIILTLVQKMNLMGMLQKIFKQTRML